MVYGQLWVEASGGSTGWLCRGLYSNEVFGCVFFCMRENQRLREIRQERVAACGFFRASSICFLPWLFVERTKK